jgi:hypothetical protein
MWQVGGITEFPIAMPRRRAIANTVTATDAGTREDKIHAEESSAIIALCIADS